MRRVPSAEYNTLEAALNCLFPDFTFNSSKLLHPKKGFSPAVGSLMLSVLILTPVGNALENCLMSAKANWSFVYVSDHVPVLTVMLLL